MNHCSKSISDIHRMAICFHYQLVQFHWPVFRLKIFQEKISWNQKFFWKNNFQNFFRETNLWFGLWLLEGWPKKVLNQPPACPSKPVFSRSSWLKSKTVAEKKISIVSNFKKIYIISISPLRVLYVLKNWPT